MIIVSAKNIDTVRHIKSIYKMYKEEGGKKEIESTNGFDFVGDFDSWYDIANMFRGEKVFRDLFGDDERFNKSIEFINCANEDENNCQCYILYDSSKFTKVLSKKETVNHPSHYLRPDAIEAIDEMETVFGIEATMNFCICNCWKYRYRAGSKGSSDEDLKKSDWYMKKYIELKGRLQCTPF